MTKYEQKLTHRTTQKHVQHHDVEKLYFCVFRIFIFFIFVLFIIS